MIRSSKSLYKNLTPALVRDKPLSGHTSSSTEIIVVSINPSGSRVVTSRTDRSLRIWKFQPDKSTLVDPIIIEDAHSRSVESISWNPRTDHSFATVGRDEHVKLWRGNTGKLESQFVVEKSLGQTDAVCLKLVRYSKDGKVLVVVDRDSTILVYSVDRNYQKLAETKSDHHIYDLQWFHQGHSYFVVASHDGTVPIYKSSDGEVKLISSLEGHRSSVTSVAIDPRGGFIAVGSNEGTLSIWNTATMLNTHVITSVDEAIASVDISRDGGQIAVAYDRGSNIRIFESDTGNEIHEVPNSVSGQSTFASVVWFPHKPTFVYTSDHGTTLALLRKSERS